MDMKFGVEGLTRFEDAMGDIGQLAHHGAENDDGDLTGRVEDDPPNVEADLFGSESWRHAGIVAPESRESKASCAIRL